MLFEYCLNFFEDVLMFDCDFDGWIVDDDNFSVVVYAG